MLYQKESKGVLFFKFRTYMYGMNSFVPSSHRITYKEAPGYLESMVRFYKEYK